MSLLWKEIQFPTAARKAHINTHSTSYQLCLLRQTIYEHTGLKSSYEKKPRKLKLKYL